MTLSAFHTSPASLALREGADHEPDRLAIETDDYQLSYGELNEQADRLANRLASELGSGQNRVALRANGTHELAVGTEGEAVPIDRERGELASIIYTSGSTGTPKASCWPASR